MQEKRQKSIVIGIDLQRDEPRDNLVFVLHWSDWRYSEGSEKSGSRFMCKQPDTLM